MKVKTMILRNAQDPAKIDSYLAFVECPEFERVRVVKNRIGWLVDGEYIRALDGKAQMIERKFRTKKECLGYLSQVAIPLI